MTTKDDTAERPGNPALADFRGAEPDKSGDTPPSPPVADDDGSGAPVQVAGTEPPPEPEKVVEPQKPAPRMSKGDEQRAKIAERFSSRRDEILDEASDPPDPPPEGADTTKTPETPPSAGSSDSGAKPDADAAAPADQITLTVHGKPVNKSIAEIAVLADLSPEEVKADPKRAVRYAQRELATKENLDEARRIRRETPSRQTDEPGTRPARPAPDQERQGDDGNDAPDQQDTSRQTSAEDMAKLIEDIQIGDPKEVAPKLRAVFAKIAGETANEAVQQSRGDTLLQGDFDKSTKAVTEFRDEHPEIVGKPLITTALSSALNEEYREDLITALVAEGKDQDEAEQLVRQAAPEQVRNAHQKRRLGGDPNVRQIDKALMEKAYERVKSEFGITAIAPKPQQDGLPSREQRKQTLPQQPRRASTPPATPPAQQAPLTRKQVVAEMASRTGKKRSMSFTR